MPGLVFHTSVVGPWSNRWLSVELNEVVEVVLHCPQCEVEWSSYWANDTDQCWICGKPGERGRAPRPEPLRRAGPVTVRIVDDDEDDAMERERHLRLVPDPVSGVVFGDEPLDADCVPWQAVAVWCGGLLAAMGVYAFGK